jgi:hypothetical protein
MLHVLYKPSENRSKLFYEMYCEFEENLNIINWEIDNDKYKFDKIPQKFPAVYDDEKNVLIELPESLYDAKEQIKNYVDLNNPEEFLFKLRQEWNDYVYSFYTHTDVCMILSGANKNLPMCNEIYKWMKSGLIYCFEVYNKFNAGEKINLQDCIDNFKNFKKPDYLFEDIYNECESLLKDE